MEPGAELAEADAGRGDIKRGGLAQRVEVGVVGGDVAVGHGHAAVAGAGVARADHDVVGDAVDPVGRRDGNAGVVGVREKGIGQGNQHVAGVGRHDGAGGIDRRHPDIGVGTRLQRRRAGQRIGPAGLGDDKPGGLREQEGGNERGEREAHL